MSLKLSLFPIIPNRTLEMISRDALRKSERKKQNDSRRLILAILFAIATPIIALQAEEKTSESSEDQTPNSGQLQAATAGGAAVLMGARSMIQSSRCAKHMQESIRNLDPAPTPLGKPGSPLSRRVIAENIEFTPMKTPFRARDYESSSFKQEKLKRFEKLSNLELEAFLKDELSKLIESGYGLLSPQDLQDYHEAVRDFISQGGHFVVHQAFDPQMGYATTFSVNSMGEVAVNIPYVKILKSAGGDPEIQQSLVGSTLHEIRHYVTYIRVARLLEKRGLTRAEARTYISRLEDHPETLAYHIDQLEQEARAIERRTLPHTIEANIKDFLYADMQAFQKWTKAYLSSSTQGSLENLPKQSAASRLADRIASQTAEYLTNFSDGRELPPQLKSDLEFYVALSKKDKDLGREEFSKLLVNHMFQGIKGRLDSNTEASLKAFILTRLQTQRRRIESAIQKLLHAHPETKPHGIK